jgi:organic hydroperoxide reductase OsmC/OhrA
MATGEKTKGEHVYDVTIDWTGNRGTGTSSYRAYGRDHTISAGSKPPILGSSDPAFIGDASRWNPEDLMVASASACHKLWYLHLCAQAGITVLEYRDYARGLMTEGTALVKGQFTKITLRPEVTVKAGDDVERALDLHHEAHKECFIANSVNFPILCEAVVSAVRS